MVLAVALAAGLTWRLTNVRATLSTSASPAAVDRGDCLTTLDAPSVMLESYAPDDTSFRGLFAANGTAAFRDENENPSQLLTTSGTFAMYGAPWAASPDGFLMNTSGSPNSMNSMAMVRPDGQTIWTVDDLEWVDGERVAVVGDTVLYATRDADGLAALSALSAKTGQPTEMPAAVTANAFYGDINSGQRELAATPNNLIPTTPRAGADQFLDTISGTVLSLPDEDWRAESASGSSLLIVDRDGGQRAVLSPTGMSAPWPAADGSGAGLCADLVYTVDNGSLTVSTVAEPTAILATAREVLSHSAGYRPTVTAAPGVVAVMIESSSPGGGYTANVSVYTK